MAEHTRVWARGTTVTDAAHVHTAAGLIGAATKANATDAVEQMARLRCLLSACVRTQVA